MGYAVQWFGGIVGFIVPVPLSHVSEAATGSDMLQELVDTVSVVIPFSILVRFPVHKSRLLVGIFVLVSGYHISKALQNGANGGRVDGNCVFNPFSRILMVLLLTPVTMYGLFPR